jgi:hypothetical protein
MSVQNKSLRLFFLLTYLVVLCLVSGSIAFGEVFSENKMTYAFLCVALAKAMLNKKEQTMLKPCAI